MEYCENGTLEDIMEGREGKWPNSKKYKTFLGSKFPMKLATDWLGQIAKGLSYCHGKNIIHHDLKVSLLIQQSQLNLLNLAGQHIPNGRIQRY